LIIENGLGDAGVIYLAEALSSRKIVFLGCLNLANNWVTDAGAEYIAEALPAARALEHLCLRLNQISNKGATMMSEVLESTYSLITLDLSRSFFFY